jgi:8-oxo-dGTP pyrophosphatase MutT (NUDIX family)
VSALVHDRSQLPDWLLPIADVLGDDVPPTLSRWTPPPDSSPRRAAILILFGLGSDGPEVLLLERAHEMRSHAGQVAFPGGAQDPGDPDEAAAALREAEEETGLDPDGVEILGVLPELWLPPSNFAVTPVLGWWRAPSPVHAVDPAETASVHTVSIVELVDPSNRVTVRHPSGFSGPGFLVRGLVVWGFTAQLLTSLFDLVQWSIPWDESKVVDLPEPLVESSLRDLRRAGFDRAEWQRAQFEQGEFEQ